MLGSARGLPALQKRKIRSLSKAGKPVDEAAKVLETNDLHAPEMNE
jgi:hypothetical protein